MERFQLKPTIYFGPDALAALDALAGKRVMVITDAFYPAPDCWTG